MHTSFSESNCERCLVRLVVRCMWYLRAGEKMRHQVSVTTSTSVDRFSLKFFHCTFTFLKVVWRVARPLMMIPHFCKSSPERVSENISIIIGQYLANLWDKNSLFYFLTRNVYFSHVELSTRIGKNGVHRATYGIYIRRRRRCRILQQHNGFETTQAINGEE